MKINWRVRVKNKDFWIAIIPAALILIQAILSVFGVTIDLGVIGNKLLAVIESAFIFLAILGVVNDPTTGGFLYDSEQALTYLSPKKAVSTDESNRICDGSDDDSHAV